MKKRLLILFLAVIFVTIAQPAQAHFLATDGTIGAVLHVDPNDEPIVGSEASFFFEFKDRENRFTLQNCDCTFIISENGKVIFSEPLFQTNPNPSLSNASFTYFFPQRDVYQIKVVGKPLSNGAFHPFTLTWNFRVDQQTIANGQTVSEQNSSTNFFSTHLIHFLTIGIFLIFFLIYYIQKTHKSEKYIMKGGEKKNDKKNTNNIY